jgi:dihydrodipicolinate synthase/N-acetylneuraminate lyase
LEQKDWAGIFPAITTPFQTDLSVDYETFGAQARWMVECGCKGIVALGSLGEAPTLTREEKVEILKQARRSLSDKAPVIAGIAALSTAQAVWLAKEAHRVGVDGLMVLPPQIYRSDWRETQAHLDAIFQATPLSCMLYNNPIAYGTDITPELVVESVAAGATGWIAGLVNAFPEESVRLFKLAQSGPSAELDTLYSWFLPLLRLDTVPKFVQLIKQVQEECGGPEARVRPPRLELAGAEREEVIALTRRSLANCPH